MEKRTQTLIDCCKATIAAMEVDEAPKKPIAKDSPSAGDKKSKKPVLDDDIHPLFDDDDDDEGDNEDSSVDLGNLVRDGQKIVTTVSNDDKLETFRTVRWITPPIYDWTDVPFLFIPVHADTHWSLIVVKLQSRGPFFPYSAIYHLDSDEPRHDFKKISGVVARWLKTVLPEGWVIEHAKQVKVLRQTNGHDCGIHVMAMTRRLISIADSISLQLELRDLTSLLSTSDIEELRIRLRRLAMAS
ncbi:hypothetical protein R1sor_008918 [Riccia sorocarpa]|uniref:Ubiquitin-like protease family profile domain-containing protein n=1 Tax=Riccia sorocarpa TaxID=122646 RepID=A0ABD3HAC1_9MARC